MEPKRHRLTDRAQRIACGKCCKRNGGYDARYKFVWTRTLTSSQGRSKVGV
jgi:hypothetical protein